MKHLLDQLHKGFKQYSWRTLEYSDYSGTFEAFGVAGMLGVQDHRNMTYDVTLPKWVSNRALVNGTGFSI